MEKRKFYLKQTNDELQSILGNKEERKKIRGVQEKLQKLNLQKKIDKIQKDMIQEETRS
jgi:hypothetical protein